MGISQFAAGQDPTPSPTPDPSATPIDKQYTWKNTLTNFNDPNSWNENGAPPVAGDVGAFTAAAVAQPQLTASDTISGLYFTGTGTSGYDLTRLGITQTLTLTATGTVIGQEKSDSTAVAIGAENTSGTNTIDVPIILGVAAASTQTIIQAAGGTLVINGAISEANAGINLSLTGAGTVTLAGANSYTGGTTLSTGTLNINNASAIGTGAFIINSGTINNTSGGALTLATNNAITWGGNFSFGGTNNLTFGTGAITMAGSRTITLNGSNSTLTFGGTIAGDGDRTLTVNGPGNTLSLGGITISSNNQARTFTVAGTGNTTITGAVANGSTSTSNLTKNGTGTLTLSGANTYTGATTVNAGKLFINGNQTAATGTTTVNGSGTVLGGTGTIGGSVSMASSGAILEGGTGSTGQTLTIKGSLTQVSGSIIELALGPAFAHSTLALTGAGSSSFYSTQKVTFIDLGAPIGTYQDIVTGVTSNPGSLSGWTITNPEFQGTFSWDGSNIDLTLTQVPEPGTWCAAALTFGAVLLSQKRRLSPMLKRA